MAVEDNSMEYVYLSELDSVNQTYDEQVLAEKALYNAIVYEGKSVILTYNQIVDSIAFLHCIKDDSSLNVLLDYFKDGKLKVNQYIQDMNISKYFQMNYHSESFFKSSYFSFLNKYPKDIQDIIYNGLNKSIQYGDSLYLQTNILDISEEDKQSLEHYIKLILTINTYMYQYKCYVSPKPEKELNGNRMKDYMENILTYLEEQQSIYATYFKTLIIIHYTNQRNDTRSEYLITLKEVVPKEYQYIINKMINLAYNSALEYSIFLIKREDHLKDDLKRLMTMFTVDDNMLLAPVKCKWKEGYRVTTIATIIYKKFERVNWKWSLRICPLVEIIRIITSLFVAFIVMLLLESLASIQVMWQTYSIALLVTFAYNLILDELQEFVMNKLPEWLYSSGFFEQIKNFVMDIYIIRRRNQI